MKRLKCLEWMPGLRDVDQTDARHSEVSPAAPHRMTPQP